MAELNRYDWLIQLGRSAKALAMCSAAVLMIAVSVIIPLVAIVALPPFPILELTLLRDVVFAAIGAAGAFFGYVQFAKAERGFNPEFSEVAGNATWGKKKDIEHGGMIGPRINKRIHPYIGQFVRWSWWQMSRVAIDVYYPGDIHWTIVGPSGVGKDTGLASKNITDLDGLSKVVLDIKGEQAVRCARKLRQKGQQVVILNLFNIQTGRRPDLASQGYNCLAGFDVTHPDCYEILKSNSASMVLQRGGDHPHFDARAQALLTFGQYLVKWLEYDVKLLDKNGKSCRRTGTLADVAEVLWSPYKSEDENITSLHHITSSVMKWEDKPGEPSRRTIKLAAASFFNDIPSNEEIGGVLATAQGQLEPLISEAFHADISKHPEIEVTDCRTGKRIKVPFNFEYLRGNEIKGRKIDKPIAVFVIIPWRERSTHAIWTRLIIGRAIRELIKEDAKPRYRTLMIVNEAASLGKLDILNDALSAVRFAGLMICSIWQDMEQIRRNFGSLGNFLTNAGVIQSYRVNDKTTADEISWRLGIETAITTSRTVNAKASVGSGNQTRAAHGFNLMDPWKLVGLKKRETICFVPECTAMPLRLHTPPRLRGLDPFLER